MAEEHYTEVSLDRLHLDPGNPRLRQDVDWNTEPESSFLREFARKYNLVELARSIADKGFTPRHAEALLVIKAAPDQGATDAAAPDQGAIDAAPAKVRLTQPRPTKVRLTQPRPTKVRLTQPRPTKVRLTQPPRTKTPIRMCTLS